MGSAAGAGKASESKGESKSGSGVTRVTADNVGYADWSKKTYSLAEVKAGVPNGDPAKKEMYLHDAEFTTLFKMGKAEFVSASLLSATLCLAHFACACVQSKLQGWKQADLKKKAGLF